MTLAYDRKVFFDAIRGSLFGGSLSASQVSGMEAIFDARDKLFPAMPTAELAYCLATARHEVGKGMQPVREAFGKSPEDTIQKLDRAWKAGQLKWVKRPYWRKDSKGLAWFGRGYPQTTHKENYRKAEEALGYPLTENPELMLKASVAAESMLHAMVHGTYRKKKLSDFIKPAQFDFVGARDIVNGHEGNGPDDPKHVTARYARAFLLALKLAEVTVTTAPEPVSAPAPVPVEAAPAPTPKKSLLATLIGLALSLFSRQRT